MCGWGWQPSWDEHGTFIAQKSTLACRPVRAPEMKPTLPSPASNTTHPRHRSWHPILELCLLVDNYRFAVAYEDLLVPVRSSSNTGMQDQVVSNPHQHGRFN